MATSLSKSMSLSSGDRPGLIAKMSSGVKLNRIQRVRDLKRSRFDERDSYKQVGHVGSGGYGNCLLLQKRSSMSLRVCKIQKRSKSVFEPLEVELLRDILDDHPRIVRLHEAIVQPNTLQLYFDYYPGGDLFGLMVRYSDAWENVPEPFIWHCFLQLSEALAYIHHGYDRRQLCASHPNWQQVIHGDLKPENIFLGPPTPDSHGYPSLVLGDFGLATIDEVRAPGTWKWQPPELPMTSKEADVWALGAVIHALAHDGRAPLRPRPEGMSCHDFYRWPGAREPTSLLGLYSDELHNLVIHGALQFNPYARYTSLELLHCVVDEVELGVASEMMWEQLHGQEGSGYLAKTYDENGVTEKTIVSPDGNMKATNLMRFQEHEPMGCCDAMQFDQTEFQEPEPMACCDAMQ